MRLKHQLLAIAVTLGAFVGSVFTCPATPALAARNSSGTYSLPSGNPVVTGTTISSTWANTTLGDLGTELTNSLDRNGRGAMLAPLQLSSGTVTAPGLTFSSENGSGLFRNASNDIRMSVNQATVEQWTTSGVAVTGTESVSSQLAVSGGETVAGLLFVDGGVQSAQDVVVDVNAGNAGTTAKALRFGSPTSGEGIGSKRTSGGNQFGLDLYAGGAQQISLLNSGGVEIPGSTAATPGTKITASYGATYNIAFGTINSGTCNTSTQTLTGVAVGAVCMVSVDGNIAPAHTDCYASIFNSIVIRACTPSTVTLSAGNFRVRVFQ